MNFYMMVGLPGSGKTMKAEKIIASETNQCNHISSDNYRQIMFGDVNDQTHNEQVFKKMHDDTISYLNAGCSVVYDATNTTLKNRLKILRDIQGISCHKIAVVVAPPIETCIEQDSSRERTVGEEVIRKFLCSFQFPQKFEGFDEIWVNDFQERELPKFDAKGLQDLKLEMNHFDQKNPHHIYTVGGHCDRVFQSIYGEYHSWTPMAFAGSIHDIGKLFTQKLDENRVAHYYNHDNVGTYYLVSHIELLTGSCWDDLFEELFYVNYHMRAHRDFQGPKAEKKYRALFGGDRFDNLMRFGEYDRRASGTYENRNI